MNLKGAVERVSIFEISEFGEERKVSPLLLPFLSHSYSVVCWPKSPWEKGDLFFWTPI